MRLGELLEILKVGSSVRCLQFGSEDVLYVETRRPTFLRPNPHPTPRPELWKEGFHSRLGAVCAMVEVEMCMWKSKLAGIVNAPLSGLLGTALGTACILYWLAGLCVELVNQHSKRSKVGERTGKFVHFLTGTRGNHVLQHTKLFIHLRPSSSFDQAMRRLARSFPSRRGRCPRALLSLRASGSGSSWLAAGCLCALACRRSRLSLRIRTAGVHIGFLWILLALWLHLYDLARPCRWWRDSVATPTLGAIVLFRIRTRPPSGCWYLFQAGGCSRC
jgi:hypothetical protein